MMNWTSNMQKVSNQYYYDKTYVLGQGSSSIVYKGFYLPSDQVIACKIIKNKIIQNDKKTFERQLEVLKKVSEKKHQNIMDFYGYENLPEAKCLFLQYCPKTLTTLIQNKISENMAIDIVAQILDAMDFFNNLNGQLGCQYLHRDLKPDNILIGQNNNIKIADFGLSREYSSFGMSYRKGTPLYQAPEIFENKTDYDIKCDVWSAGLIFYKILTGKNLYTEKQNKNYIAIKNGEVVKLPFQFNPFWNQLLSKMLKYHKEERSTFHELNQFFSKNRQVLQEEVAKKYGLYYSKQISSSKCSQMIASISPSNPLKSSIKKSVYGFESILRAIEEEECCQKLNKIPQKNVKFMYGPFKTWWGQQIVSILIGIAFTAISSCFLVAKLCKQLEDKCIQSSQFGTISSQDIIENHQSTFKEIIQQYYTDFLRKQSKHKAVLRNQIIANIQVIQNSGTHPDICQSHHLYLEIVDNFNNNIWLSEEQYIQKYRQLINKPPFHRKMHILQYDDLKHLHIYFGIRIICFVDQVFPNNRVAQEQYIARKRQEIYHLNKQQLLDRIHGINDQ